MATTTITYLGAFLVIALSLSSAWSFSVQIHSLRSNPRAIHTSKQTLQQYRHPQKDRTSLGFRNPNHEIDSSGLDYRNDGNDEKEGISPRFESLVLDTSATIEKSSRKRGVRDRKVGSAAAPPSTFALGWSTYVPRGVSASVFSSDSSSSSSSSSPLVLTPDRTKNPNPSEAEFLRSFLRSNQNWIDSQILEYGGIVFRDFGDLAGTVSIGKEILRALDSGNPGSGHGASSSSSARKGFEIYLVSSEHDHPQRRFRSSMEEITDRSRKSGAWPKRISEMSTKAGLTDWRKIHDDLPSKLRLKLTEKDLLYTRTHLASSSSSSSTESGMGDDKTTIMTELANSERRDPSSAWYRLFGSTNRRVFADVCRTLAERIVPSRTETFRSEAFRLHPRTKEKIWFELAHRFHWTSMPAELLAAFQRTKNPLLLARAWKEATIGLWRGLKSRLVRSRRCSPHLRQRQPLQTTTVSFGDGTPISWWEMHQIRKAIRDNTAHHPWKPGDFVVVDGLGMGLQ